jgi:hypothetical protein
MQIEDIRYKKHVFEILKWFKNDGTFLGDILNEHDFNNLRLELVEHNLTQECYFMWNDLKITLNEDGDMSDFPDGLYNHLQKALLELINLRRNK